MKCIKLSTVIEKQIERLHLNDFPCGPGSWRKSSECPDDPHTEDTDSLLKLLSCSHSPWRMEESEDSWSPEAAGLKRLAVLSPERLSKHFIYSHFTTIHILDQGVSVIDDGLLKFTNLEELVLSANNISAIPAEHLPSSLRILGLRCNLLSALNSVSDQQLPRLQSLSLGSNRLGCRDDIPYLTGRHWPHLVCLDLSDCDFQDLQVLHRALLTLTRLRTLLLQGNPLTLSPSYRGFTVDRLPQLSHLDSTWISPEERHNFRGLAEKRELIVDQASVTVRVGRVKGIPNPLRSVDENAPHFPVTACSYFITYDFLSHHTVHLDSDRESKVDAAHAMDSADSLSDADTVQSNGSHEEASKSEYTDDSAHVSRQSTVKLTWSECLDFNDTQTFIVSDLRALKKFFSRGLYLTITEEKVTSRPAAGEEVPSDKPSRAARDKKGHKGKDTPVKSGSTKDKSRDRKKKCAVDLVQDDPVFRSLGLVHVPLKTLITGGQKVHVTSDLQSDGEVSLTLEKDVEKKLQEEDKKKESKPAGKNPAASKGKGKGRKEMKCDVQTDDSESVQHEAVSVEVSVELEKWQSASEAHQLLQH